MKNSNDLFGRVDCKVLGYFKGKESDKIVATIMSNQIPDMLEVFISSTQLHLWVSR